MARIAMLAAAAVLAFSTQSAIAAGINWEKYMNSAPAVAAIASAVAFVDSCSQPLIIQETKHGDEVHLVFSCNSNEDEEGAAIVIFQDFGGGRMIPMGFQYAG